MNQRARAPEMVEHTPTQPKSAHAMSKYRVCVCVWFVSVLALSMCECVKFRLVSESVGGRSLRHAYAFVMPILAKELTIL